MQRVNETFHDPWRDGIVGSMAIPAHRVVITAPGGFEMLRYEEHALETPRAGEALIRQTAIGLNFIDSQHRSGRYKLPSYPAPIGVEAVGVVEETGEGVTDLRPGDRVGYVSLLGAYADRRVLPADRLLRLPPGLDDRLAAASLLKGITAHYLLHSTYLVRPGDTILVHAASGGVGLLLCQWAKHLGATVIGTVSTDAKARVAAEHGCDLPIVYTREDFVAHVREATGGRGVPVVYDAVGKDTFEGSLRCLAPRGLLVSFGTPSGAIPPFDLFRLNLMGSLFVTNAAFAAHTSDPAELRGRAEALFAALASGVLRVAINQSFRLAEARQAHAALQARRTVGASVILP
jgi:NADPH2:quinone reductase